jgi:hypothetical protein
MEYLLLIAGRASGALGLLLCALAGAGRLAGRYVAGGFQLATVMQLGIALLVAGCFLLLWILAGRSVREH